MIAAFGTDLKVVFQVFVEDSLAALVALDPQIAGDIKSFADIRRLFGLLFAFEPVVDTQSACYDTGKCCIMKPCLSAGRLAFKI